MMLWDVRARGGRLGFARLIAAVCNEPVGAAFAREAWRLARHNRDSHPLVDICGFTTTPLTDDGAYNPRDFNDDACSGSWAP